MTQESDIKYNAGTPRPRPGTQQCTHCRLHVTKTECGLAPEAHYAFAAATCSLLCLLPLKWTDTGPEFEPRPIAPGLPVGVVNAWQDETGRGLIMPISEETYEEIRQWAWLTNNLAEAASHERRMRRWGMTDQANRTNATVCSYERQLGKLAGCDLTELERYDRDARLLRELEGAVLE